MITCTDCCKNINICTCDKTIKKDERNLVETNKIVSPQKGTGKASKNVVNK
jgi:hypothetical protein